MERRRVTQINRCAMRESRKKILFLARGIGLEGVGRSVTNISSKLAASGHEVIIMTLHEEVGGSFGKQPHIKYRFLGLPPDGGSAFASLLNLIKSVRSIRRALREEDPDVAIAMVTVPAIFLALARERQYTAIGAERGFPGSFGGARWRWLRRFAYSRLDTVVVQTELGKDWLLENTLAKNVVVIPNWIDLPLPELNPKILIEDYLPATQNLLLSAGRLEKSKGFDRLILAFNELASTHRGWRLAIVGEGDERKNLEKLISDLNLSDRVTLPGVAGNISSWYTRASIFALTSTTEGFPNVLLEALAHGCAVVSVDCSTGPRDMIQHEENGLLIPQDDHGALVASLERLMLDEKLRKFLGSSGERVREKFSPDRIFSVWEDLLVKKKWW